VSVAGVRVVEFGSYRLRLCTIRASRCENSCASIVRVFFANNTVLVCPFVVQITARTCSVLQQHRRRVSAAHLAGSCIPTREHFMLSATRRQHNGNVLMHAPLTPTVLELTGLISGTNVGCIRCIITYINVMVSHTSKSSDDAI